MVDDVGALLRTYVDRIPLDSADNLPVHLAGHPPGAVLVFVGLVRLGLESYLAAGLVVVAVAATVPAAVAVTLDRLGARWAARTALPFLVLGPSAVFMAVSADAVFAATAAWGMAALAGAGAAPRPWRGGPWRCCGAAPRLVPHGVLRAGAARPARPRGAARLAGHGAPAGHDGRGTAGVALPSCSPSCRSGSRGGRRTPFSTNGTGRASPTDAPAGTGCSATSAALLLCAGPMLAAGLGAGAAPPPSPRPPDRGPGRPGGRARLAGVAMVAVADLSLMSKAEVERIWLPFVPWLLLSVVWLPPRWQRWGLVAQGVVALLLAAPRPNRLVTAGHLLGPGSWRALR